MSKKNETMSVIKSSAAEYLTYIAATGDPAASYEMRHENENIWLTQKRQSNCTVFLFLLSISKGFSY